MLRRLHRLTAAGGRRVANLRVTTWRRFVALFMGVFVGGVAILGAFILLVDPYGVVPFSLPIERRIVSISQRYMYPQVIRSRRFDSLIVGSSTGRLIDPQALNGPFDARFVNLAMNAATAWEQWTVFQYFLRHSGVPKALIVAVDHRWCEAHADRNRITTHGFPNWLWDDNPWNDYPNLFNSGTLEVAGRMAGNQLGLYRERIRYDGFEVFTPPEQSYDLVRARRGIWLARPQQPLPDLPPPALSDAERRALPFPALAWMDEMLGKLPASTRKVLAYMPVHVAAQAWPGTREAALEAECKSRIAAIARARGATVVDWRIASPITTQDANYWDGLHYRLPIAQRLTRELTAAVIDGAESADGDYRLVVR